MNRSGFVGSIATMVFFVILAFGNILLLGDCKKVMDGKFVEDLSLELAEKYEVICIIAIPISIIGIVFLGISIYMFSRINKDFRKKYAWLNICTIAIGLIIMGIQIYSLTFDSCAAEDIFMMLMLAGFLAAMTIGVIKDMKKGRFTKIGG